MPRTQDSIVSLAQKIQALTLVEHDVSTKEVKELSEVFRRSITNLKKRHEKETMIRASLVY